MVRKKESRFLERLSRCLIYCYFFLPPLGFAGAAGLLAGLAVLVEAVTVFTAVFDVLLFIFVYVVYVIFAKIFFNFYLIGQAPVEHSAMSNISEELVVILIRGLTLALAAK